MDVSGSLVDSQRLLMENAWDLGGALEGQLAHAIPQAATRTLRHGFVEKRKGKERIQWELTLLPRAFPSSSLISLLSIMSVHGHGVIHSALAPESYCKEGLGNF